MKKLYYSVTAALLSMMISSVAFAQSCPMCKESLTEGGERLSEGFYNSILGLVFLPATLVGGVSIFILKAKYDKEHPDHNLSTFGVLKEIIKEKISKRNS